MSYQICFSFVVLALVCELISTHKLTTQLAPKSYHCYYEVLNYNEKYRADFTPKPTQSGGSYSVKIDYLTDPQNDQWSNYFLKQKASIHESINIHKLSEFDTTYRFCIRNENIEEPLKYQVNIASGLELMELHLLPENTDAENIMAELQYLEREKEILIQSLKYADSIKSQTFALSSVASSSTMYGVLIFTLLAIAVNAGVYWRTNKAIKARKLL